MTFKFEILSAALKQVSTTLNSIELHVDSIMPLNDATNHESMKARKQTDTSSQSILQNEMTT